MVAAHYCASPEDETAYADGDLAKLDIGVHVDGWVVDTATTVVVGSHAEGEHLVEAARAALEAAIGVAGPGVRVRRVSETIEATLRAQGVKPLRNLCGHGVGRWTVHCPPPVPNVANGGVDRLVAGAVVAFEPFATDGMGEVVERGEPQVFRLDPRHQPASGDPDVLAAIRAFRGLPFARRQLAGLPRPAVEDVLHRLRTVGQLTAYPPLVEDDGRPVAQAEHTIYVGPEGVEVLTR
jgi:methionyl aminopeptidase